MKNILSCKDLRLLDHMSKFFVVCLLTLPWLNPYTFGPTPSAVPWLASAACAAAAFHFFIRENLNTTEMLWTRQITTAWIIAAVISAAIALIQYFGVSAELSPWVNSTAVGEAYGNLRQRNQFASLTNIGVVVLLWRAQTQHWPVAEAGTDGVWERFGIVLLVTANAASASRTGLVQLALVIALFLLWNRTVRSARANFNCVVAATGYTVAALIFALLASELAMGGGIWGRMQNAETNCSSRWVLWGDVIHLISQRPWLGWGWGELDFAHFVTLYPAERFCDILDNAHNLPLHLAVELGLPAASLFMGLLTWWVLRNRPWADRNPTRQMAWAVLSVISLHSLLEYPLWYGPFQLAVGLCVLILWRTRKATAIDLDNVQFRSISITKLRAFAGGAVCLCLAVLAAASWDYWRVSQLYQPPAYRAAAYKDNTLEKVRNSGFFQDQVQFAELTMSPLEQSNAQQHYDQALRLLHFSPEPRVIEAIIESAVMLGKDEEALYYLQRYTAAFPEAHAAWAAKSARYKAP